MRINEHNCIPVVVVDAVIVLL